MYARLQRNVEAEPEGYAGAGLDKWADRVRRWTAGKPVTDLLLAGVARDAAARDCFIFFISGDKVRAPDAAQAFLQRLA